MNFLACRKDDLFSVDLAALGLPPGPPRLCSSRMYIWSYWSHPLGSLPRDKVRVPGYQRQLRDIEAPKSAIRIGGNLGAANRFACRLG
jgi:hypothetical protein